MKSRNQGTSTTTAAPTSMTIATDAGPFVTRTIEAENTSSSANDRITLGSIASFDFHEWPKKYI